MDKEKLKQCLMDTGCHEDASENILKQYESGSMENMFRLLKKERCRIMDEYHECGRKIDCMTRVAANGYFDADDNKEARVKARKAVNAQRTEDFRNGTYALAGGVVDPLPSDAPFFVKDYYDYYKTNRGYHKRSLNSNDGWAITGMISLSNMRQFHYAGEIDNAVLMIHGEKAHSCYMSKDAFKLLNGDNKELYIIPDAVHTDLYDGGDKDYIPFDKLESFLHEYLK